MAISYEDVWSTGKFRRAPNKKVLLSKYLITAKDLGIKYTDAKGEHLVAEPFNLSLNFSYLTTTPLLPRIDSH